MSSGCRGPPAKSGRALLTMTRLSGPGNSASKPTAGGDVRRSLSRGRSRLRGQRTRALGLPATSCRISQAPRGPKPKSFTREFKRCFRRQTLGPSWDVNHEAALADVATALEAEQTGGKVAGLEQGRTRPAVPAHEALDLDALAALTAEAREPRQRGAVANDMSSGQTKPRTRPWTGLVGSAMARRIFGKSSALCASSYGFEEAQTRPHRSGIGAQVEWPWSAGPDSLVLEADATASQYSLRRPAAAMSTSSRRLRRSHRAPEVDPMLRNNGRQRVRCFMYDARRLLEHLDDRIADDPKQRCGRWQATSTPASRRCDPSSARPSRRSIRATSRTSRTSRRPYVGGKHILKMRATSATVPVDATPDPQRLPRRVGCDTNGVPFRAYRTSSPMRGAPFMGVHWRLEVPEMFRRGAEASTLPVERVFELRWRRRRHGDVPVWSSTQLRSENHGRCIAPPGNRSSSTTVREGHSPAMCAPTGIRRYLLAEP
ncbi:hypothetical protein FQR65_LT20904 [Abscondita terminalis]|nr:hypothetical protein FQR65_LT20904 [Abscondita terminalis]